MVASIVALTSLFALLAFVLPIIPWPEIPTEAFTSITTYINYFYGFNTVFPIDTFFTVALFVIGIELGLALFTLALRLSNLMRS